MIEENSSPPIAELVRSRIQNRELKLSLASITHRHESPRNIYVVHGFNHERITLSLSLRRHARIRARVCPSGLEDLLSVRNYIRAPLRCIGHLLPSYDTYLLSRVLFLLHVFVYGPCPADMRPAVILLPPLDRRLRSSDRPPLPLIVCPPLCVAGCRISLSFAPLPFSAHPAPRSSSRGACAIYLSSILFSLLHSVSFSFLLSVPFSFLPLTLSCRHF